MSKTVVLTTRSIDVQREAAQMPRVMVESPLGGSYWDNVEYARLALRHAILVAGESPMAFHLVYNKALRDSNDLERSIGIKRSFNWHSYASKKVFYLDRGLSNGMIMGYLDATEKGIDTEFRVLTKDKQMNDFVVQFNDKRMTLPELEHLSSTLKSIIESNKNLKIGGLGDVTNYRAEYADLIEKINAMNEDRADQEKTYNCLAMRESLIYRGESPLVLEEFYDQFLDIEDKDSLMYLDVAQSWLQVADEIVPFVNPYAEEDEALMDLDKRTLDKEILEQIPVIESVLCKSYSSHERELRDNISGSSLSI